MNNKQKQNFSEIKTEGIRYSGSKRNIIAKILELIPKDCRSILDGCSGTTRVSQAFKTMGYNVDSNDISYYSECFGTAYIENNKLNYLDLIDHLNNVPMTHGWLTENYSGFDGASSEVNGKKKNWLIKNTLKADAIREEIEKLKLDKYSKSVALTSLILALDKVSNNLGHQAAFLRNWAPRCSDNLILEIPALISGNGEYNVSRQDILTINKKYDLVYLDIPYGTNNEKHKTTRVRYNSYYNIWNSIVLWDKPTLFGKANRRLDCSDKVPGSLSIFESTKKEEVLSGISRLISNLNAKYILFSYNNKSKIPIIELNELFNNFGIVNYIKFPFAENIQKKLTSNNLFLGDSSENFEYIFTIEKK